MQSQRWVQPPGGAHTPGDGHTPKMSAVPEDGCTPGDGCSPHEMLHLSEMVAPLGDGCIPQKVGTAPLWEGCSLRILEAGTGSHHCLPVPPSTAASPWSWGRMGPRAGASPGEVDALLGELAGAVDGVLVGLVLHHLHALALLTLLVAVLADGVQLPYAVLQ